MITRISKAEICVLCQSQRLRYPGCQRLFFQISLMARAISTRRRNKPLVPRVRLRRIAQSEPLIISLLRKNRIQLLLFYYIFKKLNHHFGLNFAAFCRFFLRGLRNVLISFLLPALMKRTSVIHMHGVNRPALSVINHK